MFQLGVVKLVALWAVVGMEEKLSGENDGVIE
jgi:hypothetical protein